jgi:hypothetical protein
MDPNRRSTSAIARIKCSSGTGPGLSCPGFGERVGKLTVEPLRDPAHRCLTVTSASEGGQLQDRFPRPGPCRPGDLICADTSEPSLKKQASRGIGDAGVHLSGESAGGAYRSAPHRTLRIARA